MNSPSTPPPGDDSADSWDDSPSWQNAGDGISRGENAGDEVSGTPFGRSVDRDADLDDFDLESIERELTLSVPSREGVFAASLGVVAAGVFYLGAYFIPWSPLQRYFLGHPVAIVATTLFFVAVAILGVKMFAVLSEAAQFRSLRDDDLTADLKAASDRHSDGLSSPTDRWLRDHDAGFVARAWLASIVDFPQSLRCSLLVRRLGELLIRQSRRGSTKHLADDLREVAGRDADIAHDSLALVRIIVWAIPMLGFLGTVIGITQTLGGLDFSDGTGAVDRLKAGLYVAFDTTAVGLVLSVLAIFLQFPVERAEQRLLADVDARVGNLLSGVLPSDDAADNQTALIAELCGGVQTAVAQSLSSQAELWRSTIDEARTHWQQVQSAGVNQFAEAIENSLAPALERHSTSLQDSCTRAEQRLAAQAESVCTTVDRIVEFWKVAEVESAARFAKHVSESLQPALTTHADSVRHAVDDSARHLDSHTQQWRTLIDENAKMLFSHQDDLVEQCEELVQLNRKTEAIQATQQALDGNLRRLAETNAEVHRGLDSAANDGMSEAMLALARAVDVLNQRIAGTPNRAATTVSSRGRAA